MVFNYTCCGQHFAHHQGILEHVERVHHVPIKWSFATPPSVSPPLSTYSFSTAGSGSGTGSNVSTTTFPPQNPLLRCHKPNCTKSYRNSSGLKYHMTHGTCDFAPSMDGPHVKDLLPKGKEMKGPLDVGVATLLPSTFTSEAEREAERRLRPFVCGVGDCPRRYKNINGLRYHYQHSGEHGAVGLALLASGQHGRGESEQGGEHWGGHGHGQPRSSVSSVSGRAHPPSGYAQNQGQTSDIFGHDVDDANAWANSSEENDSSIGKKHVCPTCFKVFNRSSSLRIHIKSHIATTRFPCPWPNCSREFNVESNMRRHYRNHTIVELSSRQREQPSTYASAVELAQSTNDRGEHGEKTGAVAGGNEGWMASSRPQSQQHHYRKDPVPAILPSISTSSYCSVKSFSGSRPYTLFSQSHSMRKSPVATGAVTSPRLSHSPNSASKSSVPEDYLVTKLLAYARRPLNSSALSEDNSKTFASHGKRSLACENCSRRKMKCDPSLFECSQCQRSGLQCTLGEVERGRSRYQTRRPQSVPISPKLGLDLPSELTCFPPPPPFREGRLNDKSQKRHTERQTKSQPVQSVRDTNHVAKMNQGQRNSDYKHIISGSPSIVSFGLTRTRSLSFHRPTERDPRFGRPYSRPSSRPSSKPPSRSSSVHDSPISTTSQWFESMTRSKKGLMKEAAPPISSPNVDKLPSRMAVPLPIPPEAFLQLQLQRATREEDRMKIISNYLDSSRAYHPRRRRSFSRPPSPRPSSKPASRSSYSPPLERKSSFSRFSRGRTSRSSSCSSRRSSFSSPVQYSPNPSPNESLNTYLPPFAPTFVFPPMPPPRSTQLISGKRVRRGFWNQRGDFLTPDGYIVYAPLYLAYPNELQFYPSEGEGYQNQEGLVMSFSPRPELPASLPTHGQPAERSYESFIVYQ